MSICVPCQVGQANGLPGASLCTDCAPGTYSNTNGSSACVACPAGQFVAASKATACEMAPLGSYAANTGAIAATQCANNFFSASKGATTCLVCPPNSASGTGAKTCGCAANFYGVIFNGTVTSCAPCPAGAECLTADPLGQRTARTLLSLAGQWRVPTTTDQPSFMPCPLGVAACPSSSNGTCTLGYTGVLCGVCQLGYHASGSECSLCRGSANAWLLPVMCVAVVLVGALAVWVSRRVDTTKLVNGAKVIVSYLQVMGSSSSSYQIPWPGFMQGMLNFYRLALMDVFQVTAVDCYVPMDFYPPFYFVTMTTVAVLAAGALVHRVLPLVLGRCAPQWEVNQRKHWRNFIVKAICIFMVRCVISLLMLFRLVLASHSLFDWCSNVSDHLLSRH